MSQKHTYILGINAYDHDVSACLLRDGEIAFAIAKERITRENHATGFYKEVVDYCLDAEGILRDDVDLVVRNCYILPVPEMESLMLKNAQATEDDLRNLANRRAQLVQQRLIATGQVTADRLSIVGAKPISAQEKEETKAKLSRVDFSLR